MNGTGLKNMLSKKSFFGWERPVCVRSGGFSVAELMITLGLMGILAALAIPSYENAGDKRAFSAAAESMVAFFDTVKSDSIKRNQPMTVSFSTSAEGDGRWCVVAVPHRDEPCDCLQTDDSEPGYCDAASFTWLLRDTDVLRTSQGGRLDGDGQPWNLVASVSGVGAYDIDPVRGIILDPAEHVPAEPLVLALHSPEDHFQVNLSVLSSGKVAFCLTEQSQNIPGYKECGE